MTACPFILPGPQVRRRFYHLAGQLDRLRAMLLAGQVNRLALGVSLRGLGNHADQIASDIDPRGPLALACRHLASLADQLRLLAAEIQQGTRPDDELPAWLEGMASCFRSYGDNDSRAEKPAHAQEILL